MNILLTSAGRRSYLINYFKDALKSNGLVYAGNATYTPALHVADKCVITPLIYDDTYISFLLDFSKKNKINAIIPLFDIDLPILAKSKHLFDKQNIKIVVSDPEITDICNDKWKTYLFFRDNAIPTPETYLDLDSAKKSIESKEITYPLIIKPRWGMGSIGIYSADNGEELECFYKKTQKEIFKSYLCFESKIDPAKCIIIQENIDGQEYGLDIINDLEANFITTLIKRKVAMRAGETDIALTVNDPNIFALGKNISEKLRHIANLDTDVIVQNGQPYVLELNCRFGGGYPFSHLAGANLPLAIIKWLTNEDVDNDILEIAFGITGTKDIYPIVLGERYD